ncbi:T9SS type A sorting domain-containing protein [Labilibacter sediminis]|nr:T9SS type A sorting domain-containing protein [Labilibacter sediminis]
MISKICVMTCWLLVGCFYGIQAQTQVWYSEAESGVLLGDATFKSGCSNASGEGFVQLGDVNGNGIRFTPVNIPVSGEYTLVINYFNATAQKLEVFINSQLSSVTDVSASNWCYQGAPGVVEVPLILAEGDNTIELFVNNNTAAPFIDKLVLISSGALPVDPINYYISASGNNSNSGQSEDEPWQSLDRVNNQWFNPGDSVFFKAGDTFVGQLKVPSSGTKGKVLYFGSYGDGNKPVIDGGNVSGGAHLAAILVNNQEYIEIANLEITNDRLSSRDGVADELAYGIYVLNNGADTLDYYRFHDLTIRDVFAITTENTEFNNIKVAGIGFRTTKNNTLGKERNIQDVIIEDCYLTRITRFGMHVTHEGGAAGVGNDSINRNMNFIFRNNHFYHIGGTGIMPGRVYNGLVENNIFEYTGSNIDPRMTARGSGAWFWSTRNIISQYNKSYHIRGDGDSYGQHIDFGNRDVILQYNYSEDSEGGFAEILGDNVNSTYRFNVSVNDGFRDKKGNSIWVSDWSMDKTLSDSNYVYNNTIYVDASITPDISIHGKNTFIYNNIFYAKGDATIGQQVLVDIEEGSALYMSNNLFYGNVTTAFSDYDESPVFGYPDFVKPGALNIDAYKLEEQSMALDAGKSFPEPKFPMAGKGIFKDVKLYPDEDLYGNPVDISNSVPHIGAYNGIALEHVGVEDFEMVDATSMSVYPNPLKSNASITIDAVKYGQISVLLTDLQGKVLQTEPFYIYEGTNKINLKIDSAIRNGIYLISIQEDKYFISKKVVLTR